MKNKEEQIDWPRVAEEARKAYDANTVAIDWGDFREGYLNGYRQAFEEYR